MNTQTAKTKNVKISIAAHTVIFDYARSKGGEMKEVVESLIDWLPVYELYAKQGLTIETAIAKLSSDSQRVTEKPDKPVSTKTLDKFSDWIERLFKHNQNAPLENRVFITQRLLLNVTKGNVNMISAAFKERSSEIMAHNERMGVNETTNRKLSNKIKADYDTVADWLIKILA